MPVGLYMGTHIWRLELKVSNQPWISAPLSKYPLPHGKGTSTFMGNLEAVKGIKPNFIHINMEGLPIDTEYQERQAQVCIFYDVATFVYNSPYLWMHLYMYTCIYKETSLFFAWGDQKGQGRRMVTLLN